MPKALISASGEDPGAAVSSLADLYAGTDWYCRPVDEGFWFKYVAIGDEQLSVRRFQMHGYLRGAVTIGDEIVVQWLDHGRGRVDIGGNEIQMQVGTPPMLFPAGREFQIEYEDWDQRLVHLSKNLILDVAAEHYAVDESSLAFDGHTPPDEDAAAQWKSCIAQAVRVFRAVGAESLVWHETRRDVVRALLQLYPLRTGQLPTISGGRAAAKLATAVEYLHAHAREPLTVREIADIAGISVRGLQEAFQRDLERSPMAYLREVRLDSVHAELLTLEPGTARIGDVAGRWGFGHLGRFSAEYAKRFGEYPRQTLHSRD